MLMAMVLFAQAVVSTPMPAPAAKPVNDALAAADRDNEARVDTAAQLVHDKQPQAALDVLTTALASYDAALRPETRRLYCATAPAETLAYLLQASRDRVSAVAITPRYCTALFLSGFAMVDLGRLADAKVAYDRLLALAPHHAQYVTEYAQWYRRQKDWPRMLDLCRQSYGDAAMGLPAQKAGAQAGALRCQGYALVEQAKWDDATKAYRDAMALDPANPIAANELRYIDQHRPKR